MSAHLLADHSPRLVELAGPAGAGKSATRRSLIARTHLRQGMIWGLPARSLLSNGMQLIPSFIPLWREAHRPLWDETRHMVRLRTLREALGQGEPRRPAIIFDEGPVFAMAWLRGFGHPVMRSATADAWWRTTVREWARLMDLVVVLDAPDEVLGRRIRNRPEDHEVKQASDPELARWMERFRQSLEWVLGRLILEAGVSVLRLDTSTDSPAQLAERTLAALDRGVYAG
jgi:AAA domain